jgi:uncharacterized alpha-E superfamily protein
LHDALRRYVPKAEVLARIEEINRHSQLQAEARAEAESEAALRELVPLGAPQNEALNAAEAAALLRQLDFPDSGGKKM